MRWAQGLLYSALGRLIYGEVRRIFGGRNGVDVPRRVKVEGLTPAVQGCKVPSYIHEELLRTISQHTSRMQWLWKSYEEGFECVIPLILINSPKVYP